LTGTGTEYVVLGLIHVIQGAAHMGARIAEDDDVTVRSDSLKERRFPD